MAITSPRSAARGLVLAAAVTLSFSACSDDEPESCVALEELQSSIDGLDEVDVAENGVEALQAQITEIRDNAETARTEVSEDFAAQIGAVTSSIDGLEASLSAATTGAEAAEALATGLPAVRTALETLTTALEDTCG